MLTTSGKPDNGSSDISAMQMDSRKTTYAPAGVNVVSFTLPWNFTWRPP